MRTVAPADEVARKAEVRDADAVELSAVVAAATASTGAAVSDGGSDGATGVALNDGTAECLPSCLRRASGFGRYAETVPRPPGER
jgi:hypothetical protein